MFHFYFSVRAKELLISRSPTSTCIRSCLADDHLKTVFGLGDAKTRQETTCFFTVSILETPPTASPLYVADVFCGNKQSACLQKLFLIANIAYDTLLYPRPIVLESGRCPFKIALRNVLKKKLFFFGNLPFHHLFA